MAGRAVAMISSDKEPRPAASADLRMSFSLRNAVTPGFSIESGRFLNGETSFATLEIGAAIDEAPPAYRLPRVGAWKSGGFFAIQPRNFCSAGSAEGRRSSSAMRASS